MLKGSKFLVLLFSFVFLHETINSQSFVGTQSNFSGYRSLSMNPSLMTISNLYFDFSLVGVNVIAYDDYVYLKSSDLLKIAFSKGEYKPHYENKDCLTYPNHYSKSLYESFDFNVFGVMYDLDGHQSVGMSLNGRAYTSAKDIPYEILEMIEYGKEDPRYHEHFASSNISVATMEWAEIALAYSNTIYERFENKFDVGASLKYLMGYSATVANVNQLDYNVYNADSIVVNSFDANLVYSLPISYEEPLTSNSIFDNSLIRGYGVACDFGLTYTFKSNTKILKKVRGVYNKSKVDYIWRAGVSLMDVGFINFKNNAVDNYYHTSSPVIFDVDAMSHLESISHMAGVLSATYYNGDSLKSRVDDRIRVGLPTTLRLQFDYNIYKNYYLNATVIQPVRLFEYSVLAAPRLMMEPRYESEYFDFSLPISLYNYEYLRLGASLRIAFITIGTEKLATYLGIGDANGMDFYVSVKIGLSKSRKMGCNRDACWSAASFR